MFLKSFKLQTTIDFSIKLKTIACLNVMAMANNMELPFRQLCDNVAVALQTIKSIALTVTLEHDSTATLPAIRKVKLNS